MVPGGASGSDARKRSREYSLRKYILLLATVVATVTYTAGFSPPGGVWEETDLTAGNLAGDPIIRRTSYARYVAFFYLNAAAFASSLVVAVLILVVMKCDYLGPLTYVLRGFMVLDLLSTLGAYTAGTYRERETAAVYTMILAALTVAYVVGIMVVAYVLSMDDDMIKSSDNNDRKRSDKDCKLLMLLTTFIVSLTYLSGLSVPGGFRQHGEGGHRPGEPALLGGRHQARLQAFACFNSTAFFCSLLITVQLLDKNRRLLHASVGVAIVGLVGAYAAGSSRDRATTIYVVLLAVGLTAYISLLRKIRGGDEEGDKEEDMPTATTTVSNEEDEDNKSRSSLVVLFATLAATITYQAGLHPPGGLWEKDGDGYVAGDPILRTTNPRRYDAFFYCNSAAFVASLVVIILVRKRTIVNYTTLYALRAALILDVFGLISAYAAGSCRDVATSIYTMALAGAVPVYMVIHVAFIVLDHKQSAGGGKEDVVVVEKRRKRLLLFAVLFANITYQAGLTPPGGFWELGHRAGKPVLLSNFPRRYTAFFYCNSVSFMLSIALVIILVNPKLYRPAIKSHSLSVCGVAGMFSLVGAFAAGSTQHLRTSIKIFGLVAVILIVILLVVRFAYQQPKVCFFDGKQKDMIHSRRKKLMLLGILAASVSYQAGLEPPGGVWQDDDGGQLGHIAGNPIMRDNRRTRYQAFYYINSTSFVASIVVIMLLLLRPKGGQKWWSLVAIMDTTIVVDLLALLLAYAVGSTRSGKDTGYVIVLVFSVLAYIAIYAVIYSGIHVWLVSWLRAIHVWLVSRLPEKVDPPTDSHRPNHEIREGDGT